VTLPVERTRAVLWTRKFLFDLLDPRKTPRVPRSVRRTAASLLRHYPWTSDMIEVSRRAPDVFGKGDE
jgi:hypothetical protein